MTNKPTSTFDFSGDLEWSAWNAGVMCATCKADGADAEAIGIAMTQAPDRIKATPVCGTCADGIDGGEIVQFDRSSKTTEYDYDKHGRFCRLCEEAMTITGQHKLYGAQSGEHVATEIDYRCEGCGEESYSVEYEVV